MSTNKSESSSNANPAPTPPPNATVTAAAPIPTNEAVSIPKPTVIGIYGIQGSGKTHLLRQLRLSLGSEKFAYHDGSAMITELVPGGFSAFKKLDEAGKKCARELAIETIGKRAAESGKVALVAGHLMFWAEGEGKGDVVWTDADSRTYSQVVFLDVPAVLIHERAREIRGFGGRADGEREQLRALCRERDILFTVVSEDARTPRLLRGVLPLVRDFQEHDEKLNLSRAESKLDEAFLAGHAARLDTPTTPFPKATLLYEEAANDQDFEALCQEVASAVVMYPEFVSLLRQTAKQNHIGAVIVTCGLRRVWEIVLERNGLSQAAKVIGGGRIADGFVVTDVVKADLVTRLQDIHQVYVWAFGDGPLDLKMLGAANEAIVVVGEQTRSQSMEEKLGYAIDTEDLDARQVVLPSTASPRLDVGKLPLVNLTEQSFLDSILRRRAPRATIRTFAATNKGAEKLLATQSRDATFTGPALREVHQRIGQYLAVEFLTEIIGVEPYDIPHVQGHMTDGYRLLDEEKTTIVTLMRGGEPLALGVNDVFPLAMFVHANKPADVKAHHVQGQRTLILVDSVINSGNTIVDFVQHVRDQLHSTIRIVVVTNVAQVRSIGTMAHQLSADESFDLVALRLSENKFTGTKNVDTGNRLFNTTHLA
ncbi:hypothetical protein LOCC1_G007561 [Lachnellula occidentalis]|uniref:Phosphoribosyltransferase domain-containing protein n=1 Tax=Lachnellula occidentalis TaxID=215460 RepID=A0A8H8U6N6_9HELO|nr:hypothetical protein LOCC1_G007561 [Lachnellula occidentalis]